MHLAADEVMKIVLERLTVCRFVHTRIISGAALEKLQSHQIPFAQVEDVAAAVVRLASDEKANGELC